MEKEKKINPQVDSERLDKFWENPQNILNLIDLIFLGDETKHPCS